MMTRAFVAAATFLAMNACSAEKPYIYHQVEGEARFTGAINSSSALSIGFIDYGAATFVEGRLSLHVNAGSARIHAAASDIEGHGTIAVESVSVTRIGAEQAGMPFECILNCDACNITITELSDDLIAGSLHCTGMRNCAEPTIPPESIEEGPCGQLTAHLLDANANFRLTGSSTKPKDY